VFTFGGSTVYGVPAPAVGFVTQIQYWLQHLYPDRQIHVYNFGWPGLDTSDVLQELTRRLDDRPDLLIVITGHNEFLGPRSERRLNNIRDALSRFATMRMVRRGIERITKSKEEYVMPCQVSPWDRESPYFNSRIPSFEKSMNLIVERARQRGVKVIVGTLPSNLADWPPVYKRLPGRDQPYRDTIAGIQKLLRDRRYQEASDAVTAGFSLYRDDAMLYFLHGKIQSAMGNYPDARDSFVKARDLDPIPVRTSSQLNSIIRKVASGDNGVYLVDLEKLYEEHADNGLVGFDLILDNVHSTPLGESIITETMIQKMNEIGFLPFSPTLRECCPVSTFLADAGYLAPKSQLHLRALLDIGTYVMKTPFLNFEASRKYLLEAKEIDESSWEVWANLATLSYLTGDAKTGATELKRATE
jgi:tetratricopeptide (TPR) repeat protein